MNKVSDERLAEMLAGLEGVTPGPWEVVGSSITDWGREWEASMSMEFVPNGHDDGMNSRSDEDAAHIARCDPDTMRSILSELQSLRAANSDGGVELTHTIGVWQVVPVEPTDEMLDAANTIRPLPEFYLREAYAAMIAAAPKSPFAHPPAKALDGIAVKALEWVPVSDRGIDIQASTVLGLYVMSFDSPSAGGATNLWLAGADFDTFEVFEKRSDARAAAQVDFDQRIRSAIQPFALTAALAAPLQKEPSE